MEITINTSRCYERGKQWNDNSHISQVTLSHVIVNCLPRAILTFLLPINMNVYKPDTSSNVIKKELHFIHVQ